jgi:hypothetical protein
MALDAGAAITRMYSAIVAHSQSTSSVLISDGQDLSAVLLLIALGWICVLWILSGDGVTALMDSFGAIARFSVVTLLLAGWLGVVGGFFQANINDLSQKVSGANSVSGSINLMLNAGRRLFVAAEYSARANKCKEIEVSDPASGVNQKSVECETQNAQPTLLDMLVGLPMILMTWLFKLLAVLFLILAIAAFMLVIFMAEILFGLALTLGPILVPWLIWQRTEWLFDGWLKFTIAACLTKVVAFFMVGITAGIVAVTSQTADQLGVGATGMEMLALDEMAAFLICVTCAVTTFMMWQVPGIAQGLISGGGGVAAQKFGQMSTGRALTAAPGKLIGGGAKQLDGFMKALKGGSK